ncbi:MAG: PDZ domain-containing protein [Acidimicrobiia bacterium]|nr:PDZ domain-containing protein [Acidimicrobiia bacterium]
MPPRAAQRWWSIPLAAVAAIVPAVVIAVALLPASLVATKDVPDAADPEALEVVTAPFARVPASAQAVADRISFGQLEGIAELDDDRDGSLFFVTISEPAQSLLSHWVGLVEPEIDLLTREEKFGTATPAQRQSISLQMMRTSSQVAQFVALDAVGYADAEVIPGEVIVDSVLCLEGSPGACTVPVPADAALDRGDTVIEADGVPLATIDDLVGALAGRQPGDIVELRIERPGEEAPQTVEVELIAAPDDSGRTIIGFIPFDTASVRLPFEIDIDTGKIGGPSAGLAFTLTLIDELSEGDLTGGLDVAVTGEITLDGTVGAIGGLPQKVSAVRQVGVEHFLVPATQSDETLARAREIAGDDVEIIPVATLDEALAALAELGGDPVVPVADGG